MTKLENPWAELTQAPRGSVNARRVREDMPWNLYWAKDDLDRRLLLMRFATHAAPRDRLPRLREIEVAQFPATEGEQAELAIRLLDPALQDVFLRLCVDIIDCVAKAESEPAAVASAVGRTWRWHHLLRGGGTGRLSREEQKGLLGELRVLDTYFLSPLGTSGITAWRGPSGAAQDFLVGRCAIESKACGTQDSAVRISSEFQLDDKSLEGLFLHVTTVDPALPEGEGVSLLEEIQRLRGQLAADGTGAQRFEGLLAATGYRDEDDYSADRWIIKERAIYLIDESFPRLAASRVPVGVERVSYDLVLSACTGALVSPPVLTDRIKGSQ